MPRKPTPPIRWNLTTAAAEFGLDKTTLSTRLRAASIVAGDDNRFSTRQIVAAAVGDRHAELTGKTRAEREHWELRNEEIRRTRIPIQLVESMNDFAFTFIRGTILGSRLSDEEKGNVLAELQAVGEKVRAWKDGKG